MRRVIRAGLKVCATFCFATLLMIPSVASAQQSVNFFVGGFTPRAEDGRPKDDVMVKNLSYLAFDVKDFNGVTLGGEWLVGLGNNLEAGLGAGFYTRSVPTVYLGFVNANGSEIEQTLKLRIVPFTATVRFLPLGRRNGIEPYIGAGVGVLSWRYSESGEFLDSKNAIFRDTFAGSGSATGPVVLGGIRIPLGTWGFGGEIRYHAAEGKLSSDDFLGSKIDLGGMTYLLTIHARF